MPWGLLVLAGLDLGLAGLLEVVVNVAWLGGILLVLGPVQATGWHRLRPGASEVEAQMAVVVRWRWVVRLADLAMSRLLYRSL